MRPNLVAVDAHAHLHPAHALDRWLDAALRNLARFDRDAGAAVERVVVLADTPRAEGFRRLLLGPLPAGVRATPAGKGAGAALLVERGDERLLVLAARQLATRERLEVLALGATGPLADGLSCEETLVAARGAGAAVILPWSPGKWLGARGRLVAAAFRRFAGDGLLVADSSLRPAGLPLPALLRHARRLGVPMVAGSDPLPARAEERYAGRYGWLGAAADAARIAAEPGAVLGELAWNGSPGGRRSPLPVVLWRLVRHRLGRAAGRPPSVS